MTTRIGESWLLLTGVAALLLLFLPFSPWTLLLAVPLLLLLARTSAARVNLSPFDLLTFLLIAGYTRLALAAPPIEADFIFIWGIKAKRFFFANGIDWRFLELITNDNAHPDYPILLPLVYDAYALVTGGWSDRWIGIITVLYGIAALLIVRGALDEELPRHWSAIATAAMMPLVFAPYIGIAEGPLVAYALAALLFIRRGETLRGAVYLGFAAFTKNEGLTLIVAVAIALAIAQRWKELPRLWPAIAIPLPWLVLRSMHGLQTDLLISGVVPRLLARLADPRPVFVAMSHYPAGNALFWGGVLVACALGWRAILGKERFLTVAVVVQLLFFMGAYFVSPRDLEWHVQWSWERIVRQLMPAFALLAIFAGRDFLFPRISSTPEVNDAQSGVDDGGVSDGGGAASGGAVVSSAELV